MRHAPNQATARSRLGPRPGAGDGGRHLSRDRRHRNVRDRRACGTAVSWRNAPTVWRPPTADCGTRSSDCQNSDYAGCLTEPRQHGLHDRLPGAGQRRRREGDVHQGRHRHRRHQGVGDHRHRAKACPPGQWMLQSQAGGGIQKLLGGPVWVTDPARMDLKAPVTVEDGDIWYYRDRLRQPESHARLESHVHAGLSRHASASRARGTSVYTASDARHVRRRRRHGQHQPGADGRRQRLHRLLAGSLHGGAELRRQHVHEERQLLLPQRDDRRHRRRRHRRLARLQQVRRSGSSSPTSRATTRVGATSTRPSGSAPRAPRSTWAAAPRSRSTTRAVSRSCVGCKATIS